MTTMLQKIQLPYPGFDILLAEANAEGYDFVKALDEEWVRWENRFDGSGEILYCALEQGVLVAVGGLNCDPFAGDSTVGRIRRVYVRAAWRNRGIGSTLVAALIEEARKSFRCIRLRAENADAARLYETLGFSAIENADATHILHFDA